MKRFGYLYEKIYDWDNLLLAYKKAKKGKRGASVEGYIYDWESMLLETQEALKDETYEFGPYNKFMIYEPKERQIMAAPFGDRVVHHAIYNVLGPILDKPLIWDSYACRKGKGLHRAVRKAHAMYKHSSYHYRLDISKFYYTIDHEILIGLIRRKVKDRKLVDLLQRLLNTYTSETEYYFPFVHDDVFDMIRNRGLPIGNLTSQLFANYYLSSVDHFIREKLGFSKYIRYMDDMIVFGDSKQDLSQARQSIINKLAELRLRINNKKDIITSNSQGVDFLGFRLLGNSIRVRNQNLCRFKRKLRRISKQGDTDLSELLQSFNGHLGYLLSGNTKKIISRILDEIEFSNQDKKWKLTLNYGCGYEA